MPIYEVELKNGQILEIDAPEGTPVDAIKQRARQYQLETTKADAYIEARKSQPDFSNVHGSVGPTVKAQPRKKPAYAMPGLGSVAETQGGALDALQHHLLNIPIGIAQAGANSGDWLGDKMGIADSGNSFADRMNRWVAEREANYQKRVTGTPASNMAGNVGAAVGEVLPWMTGIGELRAAGLLPKITATGVNGLAQKGTLLAAEGAAMGAVTPVTEGDYGSEKAQQMEIGAVAAPLLAGTTGLISRGGRYLTPSGRDAIAAERLAKQYGASPEVLAALRQGTGIQGFNLTADQALKTPEAVQAGRMFRNGAGGAEFARADSQNNKALRDAAQKLAGSEDDMTAALLARSEQAGNFWKENLPLGAENGRFGRASNFLRDHLQSGRRSAADHDVLDTARRILARVQNGKLDQAEASAMLAELQPNSRTSQKAWDQMQGILNNGMVNPKRLIRQLETLSKSGNSVISGAADDALRTLRKNMDGEGFVHARALDDIRQNIGSMLAKNAPNGAVGSQEAAAYGPLKAKIANQIDRAVPGYRNSLASYARLSQPINDMEAGRALLNAIDSGGRDAGGNQAVSLNQIKQMLARDNKARYPMSPEARKQAEAMLEAVQNRSISNNTIAASGPGTAADMGRALGAGLKTRAPMVAAALTGQQALGTWPALGLYLAGEGGAALNRDVTRRMAGKAANAPELAAALEAYRAALNKPSALGPLLPYDSTPLLP